MEVAAQPGELPAVNEQLFSARIIVFVESSAELWRFDVKVQVKIASALVPKSIRDCIAGDIHGFVVTVSKSVHYRPNFKT